MSEHKAIAKSSFLIGFSTIISRILGFVRDILMAKFFGTGLAAEAFVVAQRIPNLLRDLVGEGAANSAFVPVFCEYRFKKTPQEFWRLIQIILFSVIVLLGILSVLGIIFAPFIVRLIAPGFLAIPQKFLLTVKLTRITFPYLLLIGLTAYQMGVLHTFKSFLTPSLGPSMLNIGMILSIIFAVRFMSEPIIGVAYGVLFGGVLQLCIQLPALYQSGYRLKVKELSLDFSHPAVKKIGRLLFPRLLGSAVYQLNVFIDTLLASLANIVGIGAVAAIYYANRLIQLPMAVFGIALSAAALPTMSQQVSQEDFEALRKTLNFSLRTVYLTILPSSFGLIALAQPIVKLLFQRGAFNAYSTQITSLALIFYALGLVFFAATKILISCFYSLQDTRTPVFCASIALLINIVLNIILMFPLKVGGLALASSLSSCFNFFNLAYLLKKRIGIFLEESLRDFFLKIALAALLMSTLTYFFWQVVSLYLVGYLALGLSIAIAVIVYILLCLVLKVKEMQELLKWIYTRR